jgi:hypothetical protein
MSDRTKFIISTIASFLVGYGTIMVTTGYRYTLIWDWQAIIVGIGAAGLYHGKLAGSSIADLIASRKG